MQTLEKSATINNTTVEVNFGQGRYSAEMLRIYVELQEKFDIEPRKAEKIARQAGSDAGAAFRNATATISIGKSSKDGKVTIADASKAKGITLTNPLACVRALQWIGDAGNNFVSYGFTKWKLSPELAKWVEEMEVKETV
jgi:hypothetical protein